MSDLYAGCPKCQHVWLIAKLPMDLRRVADRAEAALCPNGCDLKPVVATDPTTTKDTTP